MITLETFLVGIIKAQTIDYSLVNNQTTELIISLVKKQ
jgi:hypothetical protein